MTNITIEKVHFLSTLSSMQLRTKLGEILERVYYRGEQFQIVRKDKPMARIVSDLLMQQFDELIATDPALADTLALMMNEEVQVAIREGQMEIKSQKLIPFEQLSP
jgi:antitoxin (DNA-binding transcriptional repressor) of toxin-antitoxin stability system